MIASLPMYDRPELLAAHDALWAGIRDALRDARIAAPDRLDRDVAIWDGWQSPDLLLGQICGLPLRVRMHTRVKLVCTLDYGLPDTPKGYYRSVLVAQEGMVLRDGAHLAINDPLSHSGWGAAHRWSDAQGLAFGGFVLTDAHAQSARVVAEGRADVAFIDGITWRGLQRFESDVTERLRVVARSDATPGQALICAPRYDTSRLRHAVEAGVAALPDADRATLGIVGVADVPLSEYLSVPVPPSPDIAIGGGLRAYRAV